MTDGHGGGSLGADRELLALYDESMRGAPPAPSPGVTYEQDGPLIRAVGGFRGFVFGPRDPGLRGGELDRLIARQRDRFAARGETVEWRTHAHDRPPELAGRLRAAGFAAARSMAVLVGGSEELAARPVPSVSAPPEGVVVRRVSGAGDMRRIAAMEAAVWDMDLGWLADFLIARVEAAPDDAVVLVAEHHQGGREPQVVCAAWMFMWPELNYAGLRGGTTLPAWRGRGLYRALVAERARIAAERGVPHLQVDASDESLPVLRRLGFRTVTTVTQYVWTPPGRPASP
ncbi:GNAT family N-acetyltransferase [Streptomyces marispadix]|uniref:GNAT family N-acetyltransferase n=1 Tax=Streptomyces marispadix TaxID=2922868 RepID=A0ABS9T2V7_9ACTN|nr:GNAT family N-acetyltransferase [Streptomyces marispadix]MCH6162793.1 GNAT family N-acetyltransferase [Streptomyces marispadix]